MILIPVGEAMHTNTNSLITFHRRRPLDLPDRLANHDLHPREIERKDDAECVDLKHFLRTMITSKLLSILRCNTITYC